MALGEPRCPNCGWTVGQPMGGYIPQRNFTPLFRELEAMTDDDLAYVVHTLPGRTKELLRKHLTNSRPSQHSP